MLFIISSGIRQLQCILLKVALMFGVEIYVGVTYEDLLEPPDDQESNRMYTSLPTITPSFFCGIILNINFSNI